MMVNYKKEEVILFEGKGRANNKNIKVIVSSKNIILEKERLLFRKKKIDLLDIKKYRDKYEIKRNKNEIKITTIKKDYCICFEKISDAMKFYNQVIFALTGKTPLEHDFDKAVELAKVVAPFIKPKKILKFASRFIKK